jgi:hypothetical protein
MGRHILIIFNYFYVNGTDLLGLYLEAAADDDDDVITEITRF